MPIETAMLTVLQSWSAWQRNSGRTVGFVNGGFDLLHAGHIHVLEYARERCDRLIVAVNSDDGIRRRKGAGRPVQTADERLMTLYSAIRIDSDILFDADDPSEILAAVQPDLYVMGSDYRGQSIPGSVFCKEVVFIDRLPGFSTTEAISRGNA